MTRDAAETRAARGRSARAIEQELRELRTVVELTRTLTSTLELPEILRIVLDRLKSLTQAEALSLMLYDPERDELVFAATETLRENAIVGLRLPPSRSLASWVARSGESAVVNDVQDDPRFYPEIDRVTHFTTRNLLSVPLVRLGRVDRRAGGRQPPRRRGLRGRRSGAARIARGRGRGGLRPGHALPRRRGHARLAGARGEDGAERGGRSAARSIPPAASSCSAPRAPSSRG